VTRPDFEKFSAMSEDERVVASTVTLLRHFGPRVLMEVSEGFPELSEPPGLRALTAPDGVTVLVLRGDEDPGEVRRLVMEDVTGRYVRPEAARMLASGASPAEIDVASYQTLLRVRGQYRIELLGESSPLPRRHP
jgi:hypothetical protein